MFSRKSAEINHALWRWCHIPSSLWMHAKVMLFIASKLKCVSLSSLWIYIFFFKIVAFRGNKQFYASISSKFHFPMIDFFLATFVHDYFRKRQQNFFEKTWWQKKSQKVVSRYNLLIAVCAMLFPIHHRLYSYYTIISLKDYFILRNHLALHILLRFPVVIPSVWLTMVISCVEK